MVTLIILEMIEEVFALSLEAIFASLQIGVVGLAKGIPSPGKIPPISLDIKMIVK
jgi:hypothetical protein